MSNVFDDTDPFDNDADLDPVSPIIDSDDSLTPDEKRKALDSWNSGEKSLLKIIQAAVGTEVTGRNKKGIAVKKYLASLGKKAFPSQDYQKKGDSFALTEEHKEYIRAHALQNKPLEIARELFNSPKLTNLSIEGRAVLAFYSTLDSNLRFVRDPDGDEMKEYRPPKTHEQALARINRYVFNGIDPAHITQREELCLDALIKYTHVHRYLYTIGEMAAQRDRELFESSYIRFCYDKPDVTEEEIDMYINLCSDIVQHARMSRELEVQLEGRDQIMLENNGKIPIAVVEEINNLRKEMGDNQKRQKVLTDALQGKRADRLKTKLQENASVVQLVDLWKNEKKRKQLIQLADVRKKNVLSKEVDNLSSMDALRFELWGLGKQEAIDY